MNRGRPHASGSLGRADPFFASQTPHRNNFLESLHRSYGEPEGALPKRDEEAFKRAMEFRTQEKAKYKMLEEDNTRMRSEMAQLQQTQAALMEETGKIKTLWEELSKPKPKKDVGPRTRATRDTASIRPGGDGPSGGDGVGEPPKRRSARKRGARVEDHEPPSVGESGGASDEVQGEVLPTVVPDSSGPADEHAPEGPELGGGAVSRGAERGSEDGVGED
jgi:hypothetical protein